MKQEMLINVAQPEECRIAIVEDGLLEELYIERASADNYVGNIYKGRIVNLEPSIQAAFVDFGVGRNGFLHISDVEPQYFRLGGFDPAEALEPVGAGRGRDIDLGDEEPEPATKPRARNLRPGARPRIKPPIQEIFRRGDEVLVQVIKEGIGTKGPTLTTYISIPGRYLVMMPGMNRLGVSRKIEDDELHSIVYKPGRMGKKLQLVTRNLARRLSTISKARNYDLVYILREAALLGPPVFERLIHQQRIPFVFDFDDAIFVSYRSPSNGYLSYLKFASKTKTICRLASHVMVGNPYLAEYARQVCVHIRHDPGEDRVRSIVQGVVQVEQPDRRRVLLQRDRIIVP